MSAISRILSEVRKIRAEWKEAYRTEVELARLRQQMKKVQV